MVNSYLVVEDIAPGLCRKTVCPCLGQGLLLKPARPGGQNGQPLSARALERNQRNQRNQSSKRAKYQKITTATGLEPVLTTMIYVSI